MDRQDCKFSLNTIRSGAESLGPTVSNVEHESPIFYKRRMNHGGQTEGISHQLHSVKLTLQWKMDPLKMYFLLKWRYSIAMLVYKRVLYNKNPGLMIRLMFVQDIFFNAKARGTRCCWRQVSHSRLETTVPMIP